MTNIASVQQSGHIRERITFQDEIMTIRCTPALSADSTDLSLDSVVPLQALCVCGGGGLTNDLSPAAVRSLQLAMKCIELIQAFRFG